MNEYPKIQTVFLRDPTTGMRTLLMGQYAEPECEYLASNPWVFTEKVDGTNVRVVIERPGILPGMVTFGGKTEESQLPAKLVSRLEQRFLTHERRAQLTKMFPGGAVLYGEGFGAGIQGAGPLYAATQDFVLFDVLVATWWLQRSALEDIGTQLDLPVVPVIGEGTLAEMVERCREGFCSAWGTFNAEGIVARPAIELRTRVGHRIITKLKRKDFAREG